MRFGYFDDTNKEYVIERPDHSTILEQLSGIDGIRRDHHQQCRRLRFYKSAAQGRFTRLRFNVIPMDQPGRYLYLHDKESKDFWSTSWQPVGKPLKDFKTECRHGSAYTKISSEYSGIQIGNTLLRSARKKLRVLADNALKIPVRKNGH